MSDEERMDKCSTCKYWDLRHSKKTEIWHIDDLSGECRRNAPRPTTGQYEAQVLDLLSSMTWVLEEGNVDKDFDEWDGAEGRNCQWPDTSGDDWCGEWSQRDIPIELDSETRTIK
jgi:hypothetical protein